VRFLCAGGTSGRFRDNLLMVCFLSFLSRAHSLRFAFTILFLSCFIFPPLLFLLRSPPFHFRLEPNTEPGTDENMAQAALQVTPFPTPGTNGAGTPPNFAGSGNPFSDPVAGGAWPDGSAIGEWAQPRAHFAGESGSSAFASAGSFVGASSNDPSSRVLAATSGVLPSGKMARYGTPPARTASSVDGGGAGAGEPPRYEA
jgi:hypothetical protein